MTMIRTLGWKRAVMTAALGILLAAAPARAGNLVRNGQLDDADLSEFTFRPMRDKDDRTVLDSHAGLFVETATGNRCYRIDIDRYVQDSKGKTIHAAVAVGGAKGYDFQDGRRAIQVEPGTTYNVSFECRGTATRLGINPIFYRGEANGYEQMDHKGKASPGSMQVTEQWTPYHGTFTTHADTTRVVLRLNVYTHEQYGIRENPGTYVLIDNLVVEKAESVLDKIGQGTPDAAAPAETVMNVALAPFQDGVLTIDGRFDEPAWAQAPEATGFRMLREDRPDPVGTTFQMLAGAEALYVAVRCDEPTPDRMRLAIQEDGGKVFNDDSIELFAVDAQSQGPLQQFVINALGTRFLSAAGTSVAGGAAEFGLWRSAVQQTDAGWQVEMAIPYALLGLTGRPADGDQLKINVARNRYAEASPHSSWTFMQGNFHNVQRFGDLVFGSLQTNLTRQLNVLKERVASLRSKAKISSQALAALESSLAQIESHASSGQISQAVWCKAQAQLNQATRRVTLAAAGAQPFAVSVVAPTERFDVPYLPESFVQAGQAIKVQASVNEFESLPIAITNLTEHAESYRVVLLHGESANGTELEGMSGSSEGVTFPREQLHEYEVVAVRSGNSNQGGRIFDALAPMGPARTIQVMPRQASLVWFTFDCRDVPPGEYRGTLRVIPLSEPGVFNREGGWHYEGAVQDLPVQLTVWPIKLSKQAIRPTWLMREAVNPQFYADLIEHGNTHFQLSPWAFPATFGGEGQLTPGNLDRVKQELNNYVVWSKQQPDAPTPACVVGFSAYRVFYEQWARKQFKMGDEAWQQAWSSWLRMVENTVLGSGFAPANSVVELWDEPRLQDQAEVIASLKVARKACSRIKLMVTLGASLQSPDQIREMAPYVDGFCVWGMYLTDSRYTQLLNDLKGQGKFLWFYLCDTNPRVEAYSYYRLHGWRAWLRNLDGIGLFRYMPGPGGYYGRESWKTASDGALAYNAGGVPVGSVRFEALREGFDDIKYLDLLQQLVKSADAATQQSEPWRRARQLLQEQAPQVVERFSHDPTRAQAVRADAATLIMQLQR